MNVDMVSKKREAIEGFLPVWSNGIQVSKTNPEVVEVMVRNAVPEEWEDEGAGLALLERVIGINISITDQLGDLQSSAWTEIQPRLLSSGAIEKEVDVANFLNNAYIAAANDFDRAEVTSEVTAWVDAN